MNEFKTYHPIVNFVYFVFVIGFSMFFMHPVCLCISLLCAFTYSVMLKGEKGIKLNLIYMIPMVLFMAILNPLFNHQGATVIEYLPSGNPLTLESIVYGICSALMLTSVICWFSCYNLVMTSDKFIYLFGKIIPSLSLIISMTLRFIPKFTSQLKIVVNAQKTLGCDVSNGSIIKRAKHGINILSIMLTWSLENAIDTSDSMKSRGYGISGRTAFSIYTFDKRDKKALFCILILGVYVIFSNIIGGMDFSYFPNIKGVKISPFVISVFVSYFALCVCPIIIEIWEVRRWKALESKI